MTTILIQLFFSTNYQQHPLIIFKKQLPQTITQRLIPSMMTDLIISLYYSSVVLVVESVIINIMLTHLQIQSSTSVIEQAPLNVVSLNNFVNFTISSGNFCQVTTYQTSRNEIYSGFIPSQISYYKMCSQCVQHIRCSSTIGKCLAFFNSTVTLKEMVFKKCCTHLTTIQDTIITEYLISSSLYLLVHLCITLHLMLLPQSLFIFRSIYVKLTSTTHMCLL